MKAIVSVTHPKVTRLFVILTAVNDLLASSLKDFLHGEFDRIAEDKKELVWSIRSKYGPRYYEKRLEETVVNVSVSVCERTKSVKFNADDIGSNHEQTMTILASREFEMVRKNNRWIIEIGYDGRAHEFSVANAAKYLAQELLKQK
jgi:hypothetical protein